LRDGKREEKVLDATFVFGLPNFVSPQRSIFAPGRSVTVSSSISVGLHGPQTHVVLNARVVLVFVRHLLSRGKGKDTLSLFTRYHTCHKK